MKKISRMRWNLLFLLISIVPYNCISQIVKTGEGSFLSFDGSYYDYRDKEGVQMIKLWVPTGIKPVRGIFISGHGGGGGDSRDFARDENIRAFAMRLGFGVAGLHNFPGRSAYEQGAKVFFNALEDFSEMGHHPELKNVPFVMYGSSNGGSTTYGFVNYAPERAICFVSNVSGGGSPEVPADEALKVPGVFIVGQFDALMGQRGIDRIEALLKNARERDARWAWAVEMKGHEDGASFDLYMKLVEQAVAVRYPADANPVAGPVKLKDIPEESGWLADQSTWDSGITKIYPYSEYPGDKSLAGWLINKDMAYVYRALATHHNPVSLKVKEFDRTYNPHTNPGTMFSLGGPVADPGQSLSLVFNTKSFPECNKIVVFDGAEKLGEVNPLKKNQVSIKLSPAKKVYCLNVLASSPSGTEKTSTPMHFFVRDPKLSWDLAKSRPKFESLERKGSAMAPKFAGRENAVPGDSMLIAYGLSPEQEKSFSSNDSKPSEFWSAYTDQMDIIQLTPRNNSKTDAAFNPVLSHDCNMKVKAAYGSAGIYLLFEINDDNHVAWPNRLTGTENQQFYSNFDVVDVMIDGRPVKSISAAENAWMIMTRSFGITSTTRQYQVACGTPDEPAKGFIRTIPSPWDMNPEYIDFVEAGNTLGIEIERFQTGYYNKVQEWFIPWSEINPAFKSEPSAGTRVAFSAGFNDRDEGEHFPPGVTSSGGSVKASNSLRWINRSDPWGSGKAPFNWGEIVLGPML